MLLARVCIILVILFCLEIKFVQLSDGNEKVRRVIERSTLMLREIPASVSEKVCLFHLWNKELFKNPSVNESFGFHQLH